MIYSTKILYEADNGAAEVVSPVEIADDPQDGQVAETLDVTTKSKLSGLTLNIDIANNDSETQFSNIDALFSGDGGINTLTEIQRNEALKYALHEAKIKIGNQEVTVEKLSELFGKYVEQDGTSWKLTVSEVPDGEDKSFEDILKTLVSNPKQSPLAYLIQKSARFINVQAAKGYGEESDMNTLLEINEDKILGNQTRRALSGLKSWIEGEEIPDESLSGLTVENILKKKYISQELKNKIIEQATDDNVKKLWDNVGTEDSLYEWLVPYTNNYAIKEKEQKGTVAPDKVIDKAGIEETKKSIINNLGLKDASSEGIVKGDYGIPDKADVYIRDGIPGYYYFEDGDVLFIPRLDIGQDVSSYCFKLQKGVYNLKTHEVDWLEVAAFPETENARRYILAALSKGLDDFKISTEGKEIIHDGGTWYLKSFGHKTNLGSILLNGWIAPGKSWDALKKNLKYANFANKIAELTEKKIKKGSEFKMKKNRDLILSGASSYWGDYDLIDDDTLLDKYPEIVHSGPQEKFVNYLNEHLAQSKPQEESVDFLNEPETLVA